MNSCLSYTYFIFYHLRNEISRNLLTIKSEKHEMMLTFWGTSFHTNIPMPVRIANINLCICERICLNLTIKYFELLLYQTRSIYSHNFKKKWKLHKFLFMIPYTCTRHLVISFYVAAWHIYVEFRFNIA